MTTEITLVNSDLVALVDNEDTELINSYAWRAFNTSSNQHVTYAVTHIRSNLTLMHLLLLGRIGLTNDGLQVDHRNHNGLDNRRNNLRIGTRSQNQANRRPNRNGSSPYKGVFHGPERPRGSGQRKWKAQIECDSVVYYLGLWETEELAALAYDTAAWQLFGECALVNFPQQNPPPNIIVVVLRQLDGGGTAR